MRPSPPSKRRTSSFGCGYRSSKGIVAITPTGKVYRRFTMAQGTAKTSGLSEAIHRRTIRPSASRRTTAYVCPRAPSRTNPMAMRVWPSRLIPAHTHLDRDARLIVALDHQQITGQLGGQCGGGRADDRGAGRRPGWRSRCARRARTAATTTATTTTATATRWWWWRFGRRGSDDVGPLADTSGAHRAHPEVVLRPAGQAGDGPGRAVVGSVLRHGAGAGGEVFDGVAHDRRRAGVRRRVPVQRDLTDARSRLEAGGRTRRRIVVRDGDHGLALGHVNGVPGSRPERRGASGVRPGCSGGGGGDVERRGGHAGRNSDHLVGRTAGNRDGHREIGARRGADRASEDRVLPLGDWGGSLRRREATLLPCPNVRGRRNSARLRTATEPSRKPRFMRHVLDKLPASRVPTRTPLMEEDSWIGEYQAN